MVSSPDTHVAETALACSRQTAAVHVSVLVPCRDEIRHIRAFLDCVLSQDLGSIRMEILISDGMSVDGTRRVLREYSEKFSAIRAMDNPDQAAPAGLNRAIREARGEIILRMDAHTLYAPDYVRTCVEVLQETGADNVGGPARTQASGYLAKAIAGGFHSRFACGGAKFRDPGYEGPVRTVPYGCWRKSTLERIGFFDPQLIRGQDDDLNFRIVSAGGTVWQSPKIVSWYRPRSSLPALFRQFHQNGFWKVAAIRKHGRPPSWRNLVPALCLVAAPSILLAAAIAKFMQATAVAEVFFATWLVLAGAYLAGSLASAIRVASQQGWKLLPVLPVVFATYQLSYGLGFLRGIFCWPVSPGRPNPERTALRALPK